VEQIQIILKDEKPNEPMLLKCPIDGEEYWDNQECPRAAIHEKIRWRILRRR